MINDFLIVSSNCLKIFNSVVRIAHTDMFIIVINDIRGRDIDS